MSDVPPADLAPPNVPEFSVSELSAALKRTIEDTYGFVRVRGEIGRVARPGSGHIYLDLKDERAVLNGVIWKGVAAKLKVKPEQGLEVVCTGRLTTFPGQSRYQIVIEHMAPAGVGALMALLEERRKKLMAEGLFAEERKKPLPFLPQTIGVVTSPTGAVIRDILHRLADRFPRQVLVWPVRVQGEQSAAEITAAIEGFNRLAPGGAIPRPDLIIVARGGGSVEDLWSFNEENVVRAAAASAIPIISAVGHETDTTLIDFAADKRAPTPSAAAEIAVPVRTELLADTMNLSERLIRAQTRRVTEAHSRIEGLARGLPRLSDVLALPRQRLDHGAVRLGQALASAARAKRSQFSALRLAPATLGARVNQERQRLSSLPPRLARAQKALMADRRRHLDAQGKLLTSYSYEGVLERGFALVRNADGSPRRNSKGAKSGDDLTLEFAKADQLAVTVTGADAKPVAKKSPKLAKKPNQGQLF